MIFKLVNISCPFVINIYNTIIPTMMYRFPLGELKSLPVDKKMMPSRQTRRPRRSYKIRRQYMTMTNKKENSKGLSALKHESAEQDSVVQNKRETAKANPAPVPMNYPQKKSTCLYIIQQNNDNEWRRVCKLGLAHKPSSLC